MAKANPSVQKRLRERKKREKAEEKAKRKAERLNQKTSDDHDPHRVVEAHEMELGIDPDDARRD
ncbi:MAG TPA: hypothetical protein PKE00_07745 [Planctomycetota bacterium]|nr:hypothetical protein [Planctomycetota bacterium]